MSEALMNGRELPEGWRWMQIQDAFAFTRKPRELLISAYTQVPFVPMDLLPIGNVYFDQYVLKSQDELTSGTYFEAGDMLVAKITPSFENGKQGIIEHLPTPFGIATTEVIPLRGIPGLSDKLFLFYYLLRHSIRAELAGKMEGTTGRQRLNKSALESLEIPLPPLPEQRAIAHALRTVQAAREARRREAAPERERKAALMQRLFTRGTRDGPTKTTEIGEVPMSWKVCALGELAQVAYGLTVNQSRRGTSQTAPYLTVANVTRGSLRLNEVKEIGIQSDDIERYRLKKGDVLLIEGNGNPTLLGSAAIWNDELPFALHQNHLIRVRSNQTMMLPDWLMNYINSDAGRAQLLGRAKTSSGLHSINSRLIANLQIPVPYLAEQRTIAAILRACDDKIAALEREAVMHDELFKALLEELMTGRVRATGPVQP